MLFEKQFSELSSGDIEYLINNKIPENKHLEFKQQIPESNDEKAKIKICQGISAFANTDGGIMIFGIKQNNEGEAVEIINIEKPFDDFSLQIQNMVRDRITPKMIPLNLKEIHVNDKKVFLIEIIPCYSKPHFVKNDNVFYGRNSSGKFKLDVHEIKDLFLLSKSTEEQFEQFRVQRLMKVRSGSFPLSPFSDYPLVVHIAPLSFINDGNSLPLQKIKENDTASFIDIHRYGFNKSFNYDGLMFYTKFGRNNTLSSYTQVFRNGIIEFVDFYLLASNDKKEVYGSFIEQTINEVVLAIIPFLQKHEKNYPFFVSISLLNVCGFHLITNSERQVINYYFGDDFSMISETDIIIPTVYIENSDELSEKLNQCFDIIWNSSGYDKNPNRM